MSSPHRSNTETIVMITRQLLEPALGPISQIYHFFTSSFFRFLIGFGVLLILAGAVVQYGPVAGHLGLYGATSIVVGVLGRVIIRLKLKKST